jgi:DNA modification methylase
MKIFHQNTFDKWPIADNSVQAVITSPPYWGLRKYEVADVIIGGSSACQHELPVMSL